MTDLIIAEYLIVIKAIVAVVSFMAGFALGGKL